MSNAPSVIINGQSVALLDAGASKGGKQVMKGELILPDGSKVFVSFYGSGASVVANVPAELERARQQNAKLKAKQQVFDSAGQRVVGNPDGGAKHQAPSITKMEALKSEFEEFMAFKAMRLASSKG